MPKRNGPRGKFDGRLAPSGGVYAPFKPLHAK